MSKINLKAVRDKVKTSITVAISNGLVFSVQIVPLETVDGDYLDTSATNSWGQEFMETTMKPIHYGERALTGMKKKWEKTNPGEPFVPKKQMADMLTILIVPSITKIAVFTSIPNGVDYDPKIDEGDGIHCDERMLYCEFYSIPLTTTVFKHRDVIHQKYMAELIAQKIYVPEEEDDEPNPNWELFQSA